MDELTIVADFSQYFLPSSSFARLVCIMLQEAYQGVASVKLKGLSGLWTCIAGLGLPYGHCSFSVVAEAPHEAEAVPGESTWPLVRSTDAWLSVRGFRFRLELNEYRQEIRCEVLPCPQLCRG